MYANRSRNKIIIAKGVSTKNKMRNAGCQETVSIFILSSFPIKTSIINVDQGYREYSLAEMLLLICNTCILISCIQSMRGGQTCSVSVSEHHSEGLWNNLLPERQRCVMVPAGNVKQHYYWSNLSAAEISLRVSRAGPFLTSLFILAQITGCFLPLSLSISVLYFVSCFLTGYTDMGLPWTE